MDLTRMERRASAWGIAAARLTVGLLWLSNVHWKRPPDFGKKTGTGLARWVTEGIDHPVFPPYSWILEHIVRRQLSAFGWITLTTETLLAVLLVLGLWARPVALVGAAMSTAIALTVLDAPNEWPWAYFLMVAIHLLLASIPSGEHLGLDGWRRRNGASSTVWATLGVAAIAIGLAGVIASADDDATAKFGSLVGSRAFEVKLFWFNLVGALLCVAIGVLAVAAAKLRRLELALAGAALAWLAALQVVVQWRGTGAKETGGILGGTAGTLCLWLILAVGLTVSLTTSTHASGQRL